MIKIKTITIHCEIDFETKEDITEYKKKVASALQMEHRNIYMNYEDLTVRYTGNGTLRIENNNQ